MLLIFFPLHQHRHSDVNRRRRPSSRPVHDERAVSETFLPPSADKATFLFFVARVVGVALSDETGSQFLHPSNPWKESSRSKRGSVSPPLLFLPRRRRKGSNGSPTRVLAYLRTMKQDRGWELLSFFPTATRRMDFLLPRSSAQGNGKDFLSFPLRAK